MREKILLLDAIPQDLAQCLREDYQLYDARDPGARACAAQFRIALANGESRISAADIAPFPALGLLSIYGVGYDGVDCAALKARNICLTHTPGVLSADVADLAVGLLLALARDIPGAARFVREGGWSDGRYPLQRRVSGSRVGIAGMGRIGLAIARRLAAFDCQIHYFSRQDKELAGYHYQPSLCQLADRVDFLIVAMSAGPENRHLIDGQVMHSLGPRGYLVNVARGSLVDERALIAALEKGELAGAALDVLEEEPLVPPALMGLSSVIITPHIASATRETRAAMTQLVLDNIHGWLQRGAVLTPAPGFDT
jgi:hydroxypyruvate reductase